MLRATGHLLMLLCIISHFVLLFFACAHYHNWWSLFVWLPLFIGMCWPGLTHNYDDEEVHLINTNCSAETFASCREFSWAMVGVMGLCCYIPPILAWYNEHFNVVGVVLVWVSNVSAHWAYLLWLRIFVFSRL